MLYRVRAKPVAERMSEFLRALTDGTIEGQEPDGEEIVASMKRAVVEGGHVEWYETCFCSPPLKHERATVYDRYFTDMRIEPSSSPPRLRGPSFWAHLEHNYQAG
jgi:hypothetical protein